MASLTRSDVIGLLNEAERQFPVATWQINGIHIWPLIRLTLAKALYSPADASILVARQAGHITKHLRALSRVLLGTSGCWLAALIDASANEERRVHAHALFLTYASDRILLEGKYYNRISDPLVEILARFNARSFVMEQSFNGGMRTPRRTRSRFIEPQSLYVRLLGGFQKRTWSIEARGYDDFFELMSSLGYASIVPNLRELKRQVIGVLQLSQYFDRILSALNAKIALSTNIHSLEGAALCVACRARGIPSVDIQHGYQGPLDAWYGRWEAVPPGGYNVLPTIYWTWSGQEAAAIHAWNAGVRGEHQPLVGGNAWLNKWLADDDDLVRVYDAKMKALVEASGATLCILYTLQDFEMPEWIIETIRQSPRSWLWMIRAHPIHSARSKATLSALGQTDSLNIEMHEASELPLPAILRNVDVHVTGWSAVTIEAELFGISSVVTDRAGAELFSDQVSAGTVSAAYECANLIASIDRQALAKRPRESRGTSVEAVAALLEKAGLGVTG